MKKVQENKALVGKIQQENIISDEKYYLKIKCVN